MLLYHYTTLSALIGILGEKEICFWGSRYDSMNDPGDYLFAKNIIIPKAKEWCEENIGIDEEIEDSQFYPYIVSFSELGDNLNLWRMYHGEVCLELDGDLIRNACTKEGIQFSKCSYSGNTEEELQKAIAEVGQQINIYDDDDLDFLKECCVFIKHKDYESEREWRMYKSDFDGCIASFFPVTKKVLFRDISEIPQDVQVKGVSNNDLILYKEFKFDKDILKGILIRTQSENSFQKLKTHLSLVLQSRGYELSDDCIKMTQTKFNN